ncbi:MAG: zinc ribbon domain-containing protein [Candidatus Peribacteraceae bacterium]|nr:zinc ribbon domain-containing protein [Candidatus Peribacteraceae bacterium]
MPFFDFICTKCEHLEENVQLKFGETDAEQTCPKCQEKMRKKFGHFNFDCPAWHISGCKKA